MNGRKQTQMKKAGKYSVLLLFCAILIFFTSCGTDADRFAKQLKNSEFEKAEELYEKQSENEKFKESADTSLSETAQSYVDAFAAGSVDGVTVKDNLDALGKMLNVDDYVEKVAALEQSKASFALAKEKEQDGDFEQAIDAYEGVAESDTENYANAVEASKRCQIGQAKKLIDAIGEVTIEKATAIQTVKDYFTALDEDAQNQVENKDVLVKAEETLIKIVSDRIDAIGTVSAESGTAIQNAQNSYDVLSKEQQKQVSNADVLSSAQNAYSKAVAKQQYDAAIKNTNISYDKIQNISFIQHKNEPKYISTRSYVLPQIGQNGNFLNGTGWGTPWMNIVYNYTGDDWVFWTKLTINVDGKNYYHSWSYWEITRDNGHGDVWEYVYTTPKYGDIEMLKAIAASQETIVRFEGDDDKKYDYTVRDADKQAIRDMVTIYEYLTA